MTTATIIIGIGALIIGLTIASTLLLTFIKAIISSVR